MRFISVDPGKWHAGIAVWDDGVLARAYLVIQKKTEPWLSFLDDLVSAPSYPVSGIIEIPQVYPGKPARPEDLIQLAASAGAIAGRCGGVWTQARPAVWTKKTCSDKEIRIERALQRLTKAELDRVEWPKNKERCKDVSDAIALGLHALNRW